MSPLLIITLIVTPILMFFAWSIGGEYRFGKGKRGLLLAIPLTLLGLFYITWWGLLLQVGILFLIYICLFYDDGIKMVYEDKNPAGWLIIGLNGAMIGLTCVVYGIADNSLSFIVAGVLGGVLGFISVVRIANDPYFKFYRDWLNKVGVQALPYVNEQGQKGFYINFKDAWWVSEGLMGLILGVVLVICLLT